MSSSAYSPDGIVSQPILQSTFSPNYLKLLQEVEVQTTLENGTGQEAHPNPPGYWPSEIWKDANSRGPSSNEQKTLDICKSLLELFPENDDAFRMAGSLHYAVSGIMRYLTDDHDVETRFRDMVDPQFDWLITLFPRPAVEPSHKDHAIPHWKRMSESLDYNDEEMQYLVRGVTLSVKGEWQDTECSWNVDRGAFHTLLSLWRHALCTRTTEQNIKPSQDESANISRRVASDYEIHDDDLFPTGRSIRFARIVWNKPNFDLASDEILVRWLAPYLPYLKTRAVAIPDGAHILPRVRNTPDIRVECEHWPIFGLTFSNLR